MPACAPTSPAGRRERELERGGTLVLTPQAARLSSFLLRPAQDEEAGELILRVSGDGPMFRSETVERRLRTLARALGLKGRIG